MSKEETKNIEELNAVYNLINSVFKDKSNKIEIIEKLRPCFSLKVIPQRDIDKVYSALEKIDSEKIDLVEEFKYEEEKFDSKNIFETNSKSLGLSKFDLDLSVSIFSHKQSFGYKSNEDKLDSNSKESSKIHCIHSIFISLFRIVIDFKDIKLSKQVYEELKEIDNSNVTEKKILLEKFVEKFGLYIPLELLVGGRINMCFDAENEEQKRQYHNILERDIECKLGGGYSFISGNVNVNYTSKNQQNSSSNSSNEIENLSVKMIGGDYLCKDDLTKWIKSFNIDNLQVIEYKTLIPIYCFIQGFEEKMKICLQPYDKIVLQEIFNSIENKFKNQEQNLYEGTSKSSNLWEIGITKDNKLALVHATGEEAIEMGIRDGVQFGPFLILNGESIKYNSSAGGYDRAARVAIAQRRDGVILFLATEGTHGSGPTMKEVIDTLELYGAYNAANLDGGTSAQMVVNGKLVNNPKNVFGQSVAGGRRVVTSFGLMPSK